MSRSLTSTRRRRRSRRIDHGLVSPAAIATGSPAGCTGPRASGVSLGAGLGCDGAGVGAGSGVAAHAESSEGRHDQDRGDERSMPCHGAIPPSGAHARCYLPGRTWKIPRDGGGEGVAVASVTIGAPAIQLRSSRAVDELRRMRTAGEQARHPVERQRRRRGDEHEVAVPPAAQHLRLGEHRDIGERRRPGSPPDRGRRPPRRRRRR